MSFWVQLSVKQIYTNLHGDTVGILSTFFLTVYNRAKLHNRNIFWFFFSYQNKNVNLGSYWKLYGFQEREMHLYDLNNTFFSMFICCGYQKPLRTSHKWSADYNYSTIYKKKINCDLDFPHLLFPRWPLPKAVYHLIVFDPASIWCHQENHFS